MARLLLISLAAAIACGCDSSPLAPADAATSPTDGAGADARLDGASTADADPEATCDPERTWHSTAERPMEPGDYCDTIHLCAADADAAEAITDEAPEFSCGEEPGCGDGEVYCAWYNPDDVDAGEWAQLCAITVMADPPLITCAVYL